MSICSILNENYLTGELPLSLTKLTELTELYVFVPFISCCKSVRNLRIIIFPNCIYAVELAVTTSLEKYLIFFKAGSIFGNCEQKQYFPITYSKLLGYIISGVTSIRFDFCCSQLLSDFPFPSSKFLRHISFLLYHLIRFEFRC